MIYNIVEKDKKKIISSKARVADNFLLRLIGLMFRKDMAQDEALIFYKASSIHTCFMRFAIDIVFLDKNNQIIRICPVLKPWRFVICSNSYITIELPASRSLENSLKVGDFLQIVAS